MPNFRPTVYGLGQLAYIDSFAGLVPCKVVGFPPTGQITVKVTSTVGAYRKGKVIAESSKDVVPRDKVRTKNGVQQVLSGAAWSANVDKPTHLHLGPCAEGVRVGDAIYLTPSGGEVEIVRSIELRSTIQGGAERPEELLLHTDEGTRRINVSRCRVTDGAYVYGIDTHDDLFA